MKNNILIFAMICFAILSCKKENKVKEQPDDGKLYPVEFTISAFTQEQEPINNSTSKRLLADTPLRSLTKRIIYTIYKTDGTPLKTRRNIKNTEADYNKFKDSLVAGEYVVTSLGYDQTNSSYGIDVNDVFTLGGRVFQPMECTIFYKRISLTVASGGINSRAVNLDRVTAGLQVIIKDSIPPAVTSLRVNYEDYNGFSVFKNMPVQNWDFENPPEYSRIDHSFANPVTVGKVNSTTPVWPYILNTETPMKIEIMAQNASGGIIALKTIYNVRFYRNTKTILTGRLFSNDPSGTGNAGFQTTFKTAFDADSIVKNF